LLVSDMVTDLVTDLVTGHTGKRPSPNGKGPLSCYFVVAGAGFEPATSGLWARRTPSHAAWSVSPGHHSSCSPRRRRRIRPHLCRSVPWRLGHGSGHGCSRCRVEGIDGPALLVKRPLDDGRRSDFGGW